MFATLTALKIFAGGFLKIDFKTIMKWLAVIVMGFLLYKAYSGVNDYMSEANATRAKVIEQSAQLTKFKENNDLLISLNKANAAEVKRLTESNKVTITAVVDLNKGIQETKEKLAVVQKDTTTKITVVKKKYKDIPKTPESTQAEATEISTIQINALWATFCDNNTDPLCKAPV